MPRLDLESKFSHIMPSDSSDISPPPLKRRRIVPNTTKEPTEPTRPRLLESHLATSHNAFSSFRLYSWNINGITPFLPPSTPQITSFFSPAASQSTRFATSIGHSLRTCLRRWKWPHILCLQEVKIAATDRKTQESVRRAVNTAVNDENDGEKSDGYLYNSHFELPKDKYNATGFGGQVYGVCTLIRRDMAFDTKVRGVEWDLEGRVLLIEMPRLDLVVVNVYAINGTTSDYRDPKSGKVVGTRHDRKRAFHALLAGEVKGYEQQGWEVLVAGDINISRAKVDSFPQLRMGEEHVKNRADFEERIIREIGMIDTFRLKQGMMEKYSYRPTNKPWGSGGDRVDMILVTRGVREHVEEADILDSAEERGPSDHVPLYLKLQDVRTDKIHKEQHAE